MSKGWDTTTLKKLKALTGKGLSTAEIGKRLGMSKNAIVGKLNRLGWNSKAGGVSAKTVEKAVAKKPKTPVAAKKSSVKSVAKPGAKQVSEKKPAKKAENEKTAAKPVAEKVSKLDKSSPKNLAMHQRIVQHSLGMANLRQDQCRWPIGDPDSESFHFCGEQVFVGKPYCYEHCKCAYQFTPSKKK
ncbi:MAG TPA: GcrA family cell cycle regulator [Alphaproteobacteria bacterium]|nr:GcrA family cell cycle regulator [Alphaproteobacteria bacterium]